MNEIKKQEKKEIIKRILKKTDNKYTEEYVNKDLDKWYKKHDVEYSEYEIFEFYNKSYLKRKKYFTIKDNEKFVENINETDKIYLLRDKGILLKRLGKDLKREFLDLRNSDKNEFKEFYKRHNKIVVKLYNGTSGNGVEIYKGKKTELDLERIYETLLKKEQYIVEEFIIQNKALNKIYPNAINTIRITTLKRKNKIEIILNPTIRMGNNSDEINSVNGITAFIDIKTGKISSDGLMNDNKVYKEHPITGVKIKGNEIPYFKQALELCRKLATVIPELSYIGWDIAITPNGPVVVEGNGAQGGIYTLQIMNEKFLKKNKFKKEMKKIMKKRWII